MLLLRAPGYGGAPDAPPWSALVIDGVTVPYEEVEEVRMDESALQFVVEQKPRTSHIQADPPRVYSRPEFDLWREALYPKNLANPERRGGEQRVGCLRREQGLGEVGCEHELRGKAHELRGR